MLENKLSMFVTETETFNSPAFLMLVAITSVSIHTYTHMHTAHTLYIVYVNTYCTFSLDESIQDPMSFSLLEMVSVLVSAQRVPSNAWEFILCILVTITQVLCMSVPSKAAQSIFFILLWMSHLLCLVSL